MFILDMQIGGASNPPKQPNLVNPAQQPIVAKPPKTESEKTEKKPDFTKMLEEAGRSTTNIAEA